MLALKKRSESRQIEREKNKTVAQLPTRQLAIQDG